MNPKHDREAISLMLPKKKTTAFNHELTGCSCLMCRKNNAHNSALSASLDALCKRVVGVDEIAKVAKKYIVHSQGCSYHTASGDMGEFCTCNRSGRRKGLAQALDKEVVFLRREK